jgi:hypothetical protein
MSGTRNGVPWPEVGNTMELPDDEARQMIGAYQAIPATRHLEAERAVAPSADVETREADSHVAPPVVAAGPRASERPLTTKTGPAPARKGAPR